jgi:hypothetical protein
MKTRIEGLGPKMANLTPSLSYREMELDFSLELAFLQRVQNKPPLKLEI